MEEFRIDQERFNEIRNKMLLKTIPILIIASCVGIAIPYYNQKSDENDSLFTLIVLPFVLALVGFNIYRMMKKQKEIILSYTLTIDRECIRRKQNTLREVTVLKEDITEIAKQSDGSFIIKSKSANTINIPAQIEEYGYVESLLHGFHHVTEKNNQQIYERLYMLLSFATMGLMAALYISQNKQVVLISGIALIAILSHSLLKIQLNKNIDQKVKNASWLVLLVLLSIIGSMYYKLNGLA